MLAVVLFAAACGADDGGVLEPVDSATSTDRLQVADARFDGDFQITEIIVDGQTVPPVSSPIISIETVFGGLSLMPGCNTYFGSFTLSEDGSASFTVAGGSSQECEDLAQQEEQILDVLDSVTSWEQTDRGFRLTDGSGKELTLSR